MEERILEKQTLQSRFGSLGLAIFLYGVLMNVCVIFFMFGDALVLALSGDGAMTEETVAQAIVSNGWGYMLTIAVGLVILLIWKGKAYFRHIIMSRGQPMTVGAFFSLLCVFLVGQAAFQVLASLLESFLNLFGWSAMGEIESATDTADSFSMFLYISIGAPIAEEILFRGLVLRQLEPYGKRFAIILSALLFGVFHGNLIQIPFAFVVGLVLGYVALEYNIIWAMVLHMINNMVLGDMMTRFYNFLPEALVDGLMVVIIWGGSLAAMIVMLVRGRDIGAYRRENPMVGTPMKEFFLNPGMILFLGCSLGLTLLNFILANVA